MGKTNQFSNSWTVLESLLDVGLTHGPFWFTKWVHCILWKDCSCFWCSCFPYLHGTSGNQQTKSYRCFQPRHTQPCIPTWFNVLSTKTSNTLLSTRGQFYRDNTRCPVTDPYFCNLCTVGSSRSRHFDTDCVNPGSAINISCFTWGIDISLVVWKCRVGSFCCASPGTMRKASRLAGGCWFIYLGSAPRDPCQWQTPPPSELVL